MRVLVIGAGPAGTRAAIRTAAAMPQAQVTLASAEAALPYDRVALSKLLAGDIEMPALITHSARALREARVAYRPATPIAAIDRAAKRAVTAAGEALDYDHLILATGSHAVRLPLPGADLPGVVGYRDLADVRAMLRAAAGWGQAVVIGGGLLGLEAAAGLAARGMMVTVVHAVDWPMERQLDARAGALLAARMGGRGIRFAMPASTVALEGQGHVQAVRLSDGRLLPARLVVMAVGIRPNTFLAREAGLDIARGITTNRGLFTADPAIQAIGECAEVEGQCIGLVAPALEQAEAAAAALAGHGPGWRPRADSAALKVSGTAVWSAGDIASSGAEIMTLHDEGEDFYRFLAVKEDRLVGAVLYGDTADSGFYFDLISRAQPLGRMRASLAFGPGLAA
jgi:nitrite reductase (NADH) large subunit